MARPARLHGEGLKQAAKSLLPNLAVPDQARLDQLVELAANTPVIPLNQALSTLFPDKPETVTAQSAMRSFRERVNGLAKDLKLVLRFKDDSRKTTDPTRRTCWFEGEDPAFARATKLGEELTADLEGQSFVPPRGILTTGSALAQGKRVVRCFISYANKDARKAVELKDLLESQFGASKRFELKSWWDREILVGERWHEEILSALKSCDIGLFFVSPNFLGSRYIEEHELPQFVNPSGTTPSSGSTKLVVPVGLIRVDFQSHDLKGLQDHQIFRLATVKDPNIRKFFSEQSTDANRQKFAHELYLAIENRLTKELPESSRQDEVESGRVVRGRVVNAPRGAARFDHELDERDWSCLVPAPDGVAHFERTRGISVTLKEMEDDRLDRQLSRDALAEISEWCVNPTASPFFALLGEYGIGKTTTLRHLTQSLLEQRRRDPQIPLPIYIDLRDFLGDDKHRVPTIEALLQEVIDRSWKVSDRSVTAEDLLRLVRREGAVIFFDGLDEKIVHLTPDRARAFIRVLWTVLPDANRRDRGATSEPAPRRGKLLISCRSHYFRDIAGQNSMLVGEDREGIQRANYPAFCLLPFTEEQILGYLTSMFQGDQDRARATVELIGRIHNLRDLAQRPYLLSFVAERLGDLEASIVQGQTVNAATLYSRVVEGWLNRDDGKHQIEPPHKRRLMEELAAALWRDGSKSWDVDRLEEWFDEFLNGHPTIANAYPTKDRSVLKEDLRTATFVLRPDTEQSHFRFAHTSLQEYFLACHLDRALREQAVERWNLPAISPETHDFLGQILESAAPRDRDRAMETLENILAGPTLPGAELAFRYWLRARSRGFPEPNPSHVNLAGADLEALTIQGRPDHPLSLRGAILRGVRWNQCRLEHLDLTAADLTGLEARQALFLDVRADDVKADGVDFSGLQWRDGQFTPLTMDHAQLAGCQWIDVALKTTSLPAGWERDASVVFPDQASESLRLAQTPLQSQAQRSHWRPQTGHSLGVTSCAWSPDGQRILSGASDNTLKVWDAQAGRALFTLQGHQGTVTSCAWSPDGQRILSGAFDNTLMVWDAQAGRALFTLQGHQDQVTSCAWSPDGQRILSGADDKTLKVWNAQAGRALFTLQGHQRWVTSCAWSPDGQRILSGAFDNTLKVWDAETGTCVLTLMLLPEGQTASWTEADSTTRVMSASPEAWRFLGWLWHDPETDRDRILPAEMFGRLPRFVEVDGAAPP